LWNNIKTDLKGKLWRMLVEGSFLLGYKKKGGGGCFQHDEEHRFFEWGGFIQ
jgi:hypothetical protein